MHFVAPINDQFGWGASVTSNYGLATEFNNNYAAGSMGGKTDLETLNLNLSGAYRLNNHFSFGLGFNAVYAKRSLSVMRAICRSRSLQALVAGFLPHWPHNTRQIRRLRA